MAKRMNLNVFGITDPDMIASVHKAILSLPSTDIGVFCSPSYAVLPGFCDVHVHFREPGFSYKETVRTGSLSAANGGYTDVCTMPNLKPAPDTRENIEVQLDIIKNDAKINFILHRLLLFIFF